MSEISSMPAPDALSGLELIPILQGGGTGSNRGLPLLAQHSVPRGAVLMLRVPMTADLSATTDADPGAGKVRWNNADPDAATVLYVNDADGDSGDVAAALASLTLGGYVYLQASATSDRRDAWQKWQVSSITDASGYTQIGATLIASQGTLEADEALEMTIQQRNPPSPTVQRAQFMLSDLQTALATSADPQGVWTATEDGVLDDYWLSLTVAQSSSGAVVADLKKNGVSVLTTKPAIDASEATSLTGTAAVFTGTITFVKGDIFTSNATSAGADAKGLMGTLEYTPT